MTPALPLTPLGPPLEPLGPLLTSKEFDRLCAARRTNQLKVECSLDLERTRTCVEAGATEWTWRGRRYPYPERYRERTIYHWADEAFRPVARFAASLIKLVPTAWGAPTFEIDGIKMLPTAEVSPYADAGRKVGLIEPRGKTVLDTCGGLGYFADWCLKGDARRVLSYEKNPDVLWLRTLNPWSPRAHAALTLERADVTEAITVLEDAAMDAVLHDPPRFGIAGELYSRRFYGELARVLKRKGRLFHYTGMPNRVSSGRDLPSEVANRLLQAGFSVEKIGDGVLAVKR